MLSLFKVFNGNLLAASRVVFAMGRRGLIERHLGEVTRKIRHPQWRYCA